MTETLAKPIFYPSSDGLPMAENTIQYGLIVLFKENVEFIFAADPNVVVAPDNLIYPVEGQTRICQAPDVYIAFGRPKGDRASYKVWEEGGIFPQVIVEVLSPSNSGALMATKLKFYERYGAEEYYLIDPDRCKLSGWRRNGTELEEVSDMQGFVSPRLGVRFELNDDDFQFYRPDGTPFLKFQELEDRFRAAEVERRISDAARLKAERETERLRLMLKANGLDPDASS